MAQSKIGVKHWGIIRHLYRQGESVAVDVASKYQSVQRAARGPSLVPQSLKRQAAMQSISQLPAVSEFKPKRSASDLVYQGMTIAAMLWLLVSLCGF